MNVLRRPRHQVLVSRLVLFAWLFALVSGWANACLLQGRSADRGGRTAHAESLALVEPGVEAHAPDGAGQASGDDGAGVARAACLDICDDEQSTIPVLALPAAPDLGPPPTVPAEPWSSVVAPTAARCGGPPGAAPPCDPPVAIRFLRLTI